MGVPRSFLPRRDRLDENCANGEEYALSIRYVATRQGAIFYKKAQFANGLLDPSREEAMQAGLLSCSGYLNFDCAKLTTIPRR